MKKIKNKDVNYFSISSFFSDLTEIESNNRNKE